MKSLPKIAAIQMTSVASVDANLAIAAESLKQAAEQGAQMAILPEMFSTLAVENGTLGAAEPLGEGPIQTFLHQQAKLHKLWIVAGTMAIKGAEENKVHAACLVYNANGDVVAHYNKIHLFDAQIEIGKEEYSESKHVIPGDTPIVFDSPFGKIGLAVCYDLRFPELFRILAQQGAEIFVLPAAFTYNTGLAHWEILCRARAIENLAYMIAADQSGIHPHGRQTYGHSMIIDPWGTVLAQMEYEEGVLVQEINIDQVKQARNKLMVHQHRKF